MWLFARILLREKREKRDGKTRNRERERERESEKRDERERDSESESEGGGGLRPEKGGGGGGFDLKNQGLGFAPDRKKPCYRKSNSS